MFHHPAWGVGSYSSGPPAGGNSPNISQQNLVPDHQGHPVAKWQICTLRLLLINRVPLYCYGYDSRGYYCISFSELVLRPALHRPRQPGGLAGHGQEDPQAEGQHERRRQQPQVPVQVQVLPRERRRRGHPGRHTQTALQTGISSRGNYKSS